MSTPTSPQTGVSERLRRLLLERVLTLPFAEFERLICLLLTAMGYRLPTSLGRKFAKGRRDESSADLLAYVSKGVTTVPVLVMAKQYTRPIQRRFCYELMGAMLDRDLNRGLLITTSRFYDGTVLTSRQNGLVTIDLIDGKQLVDLLIEYRLGVVLTPMLSLDERFFSKLSPQGAR